MSETILCIGGGEYNLYEGTTFPSSNANDVVLYPVAYQIDLGKSNQQWVEPKLMATIEIPARVPTLFELLAANTTISFRLLYRDVDPLNGGVMKIFSEFVGNGKLEQLIPHSPNSRSPVNSAFSHMADVTISLSALTIKENYDVEREKAVNFEGDGA